MKVSASKAAIHLGFTKDHFAVMKRLTPDKFYYIRSLDEDNMVIAYERYKHIQNEIKNALIDIYYELVEKRKFSEFCRTLIPHGIFENEHSAQSAIPDAIFNTADGFYYHDQFLRYQKIVELFSKYKKESVCEMNV